MERAQRNGTRAHGEEDVNPQRRRLVIGVAMVAVIVVLGWTYQQSLVPAIHPDHDHGLENIAGGGYLRVDRLDGGRRNLVGRPDRVLILHWFQIGLPTTTTELPQLIDYAKSVASDDGIEVVMVATGATREDVLTWANDHGVPTGNLYADPQNKTASLIGVRRIPETLFYDPEGHLVHQARGAMDWSDPRLREAIAGFKAGGAHQH